MSLSVFKKKKIKTKPLEINYLRYVFTKVSHNLIHKGFSALCFLIFVLINSTHMKHFYPLVITLTLGLLLASCSESIDQSAELKTQPSTECRELLTKSIAERLAQGVTQTDVEDYLVYRMNRPLREVKDITRYDIEQDIYIFIVNFKDGGWITFSGDFHSGPILSNSDYGRLYLDPEHSSQDSEWLKSNACYIKNKVSESDSAAVLTSWRIALRYATLKKLRDSGDDSEMSYEYFIDTLIDINYPGLTETNWDQTVPWNAAMPKRYDTTLRCLAGCAVIAIAQLVYYTHFEFGFPSVMYENASCDDYYDQGPPYDFVFSNPSDTCWNYMPLSYSSEHYSNQYLPALCATIAYATNTHYDPVDGGTTYSNYIPLAMNWLSLEGTAPQSFTATDVINEIQNTRPVLCAGTSSEGNSHAYLIDGYHRLVIREIERLYDQYGLLVEENISTRNELRWHMNVSDSDYGYHYTALDGTYYPLNRIIYIGWSQE